MRQHTENLASEEQCVVLFDWDIALWDEDLEDLVNSKTIAAVFEDLTKKEHKIVISSFCGDRINDSLIKLQLTTSTIENISVSSFLSSNRQINPLWDERAKESVQAEYMYGDTIRLEMLSHYMKQFSKNKGIFVGNVNYEGIKSSIAEYLNKKSIVHIRVPNVEQGSECNFLKATCAPWGVLDNLQRQDFFKEQSHLLYTERDSVEIENAYKGVVPKTLQTPSTRKVLGIFGVSTLVSAGTGAGIGALIGTFVFPGVGTAIGAAIGAGIGAGLGFMGNGLYGWITGIKNKTLAKITSASGVIAGSGGIGALIGTFIFPGLGTLLGAGIGSAIGVLSLMISSVINRVRKPEQTMTSQETAPLLSTSASMQKISDRLQPDDTNILQRQPLNDEKKEEQKSNRADRGLTMADSPSDSGQGSNLQSNTPEDLISSETSSRL